MGEGICPDGEFNVKLLRGEGSELESLNDGEAGEDSVSEGGEMEVLVGSVEVQLELSVSGISD